MTSATASRVVLVTTGAMVAYALVDRHFNPASFDLYKRLWGIGAFGLGLSIAADFVPAVAGPFAVLVAVALVARNPGKIGRLIQQASGQPATRPTTKEAQA